MNLQKKLCLFTGLLLSLTLIFFACKKDQDKTQQQNVPEAGQVAGKPAPTTLNAPTISCVSATGASITIQVCAGASGAPAGFSVQWMKKSDYDIYGWANNSSSPSYCAASFSGVPGCSQYNLAANACVNVTIGDLFDACGASGGCGDLECGTEYVFRSFAHNVPGGANKSNYSNTITCSTLACGGTGCTYTQGYWKTHGPEFCNPSLGTNVWPVTSLTLGSVSYTDAELCSIFNTPAAGNGLLALAHQLMAAKLNIANGSDPSSIQASIDAADALIGSLVIPPVGSGYLDPGVTSALVTALTNYNEGLTGPGHCQ